MDIDKGFIGTGQPLVAFNAERPIICYVGELCATPTQSAYIDIALCGTGTPYIINPILDLVEGSRAHIANISFLPINQEAESGIDRLVAAVYAAAEEPVQYSIRKV